MELQVEQTNKPTSFIAACKEYFGFKPGQSLMEFRDEVKALTDKDREEITAGLIKNGYNIQ